MRDSMSLSTSLEMTIRTR